MTTTEINSVRFLMEWQGHPAGSICDTLIEPVIALLERRGIVKRMPASGAKMLNKPPRNKAVKRANVTDKVTDHG